MAERADRGLPDGVVPGRRTPRFTADTVPPALLDRHRTTVWARLEVDRGSVVFHEDDWSTAVTPGRPMVIAPDRPHHIEPGPDAEFAVQFFDFPEHEAPLP